MWPLICIDFNLSVLYTVMCTHSISESARKYFHFRKNVCKAFECSLLGQYQIDMEMKKDSKKKCPSII